MQVGSHQVEEIRERKQRFHCIACGQVWTREPRSACPGVPTYRSGEVPEGFYSMTRMRLEFRRQTDWDKPHAAVRTLKAPYLLMLYDITRCEPIPISAVQESAAEKRRQTLHDRWTCWFCGTYHRHRWQQKQFHTDLQMCEGCYCKIDRWNTQIAWSKRLIEENGQIAMFDYEPGARLSERGTLRNIEILRLDGSAVPQPETFDRDAFFSAIMQARTIYAPHTYDVLYHFCDQTRYHMWETHEDFEFGVPLVANSGQLINVTWHHGRDIYRRVAIPDPYLHLCMLWGIEVDEQASPAEKMRRVMLTVAQQQPLEATPPPVAEKAS